MHPSDEKWGAVARESWSGDNDKQQYSLFVFGNEEKEGKKKKDI